MIATNIEQSRHLAELIPHDSADMTYEKLAIGNNFPEELQYRLCLTAFRFYSGIGVPAWSLSALLELIPCADLVKLDSTWTCGSIIGRVEADTPIEAACKMIVKLTENEQYIQRNG